MMFKIAFRNVFRQKRRTILTVLTMFGGFTLASISIAWSDGSYNNIIDMFFVFDCDIDHSDPVICNPRKLTCH